jgi:hypothetical protein
VCCGRIARGRDLSARFTRFHGARRKIEREIGISLLDGAALVVIFIIIIAIAAAIVALGSLPGKIARKRGHSYADAVNAASWIGLATGVFWPVAFIWAFLPMGAGGGAASAGAASAELAEMRARLEGLEAEMAQLRARPAGGASWS